MSQIVLAVHGGAVRLSKRNLAKARRAKYERGLAEALRVGQSLLLKGGSAVNAVTEAVAALEDDELFNAGVGAVLCADGSVELSASVMRGKDLAVGAVVGIKRAKNPIRVAREILGHAHGLLFGKEGDRYARSRNLELVSPDYFHTDFRNRQLDTFRQRSGAVPESWSDDGAQGTVGAVARDRNGNLAAATSTGGLVNQLPGRVGDTPVIGAGTWADNGTCAVSATGKGDAFFRIAFARRVAGLIELSGMSPLDAARSALDDVKSVNGIGGCILIDAYGKLSLPFNSPHMMRGWLTGRGAPHVALLPNEEIVLE